MTSSDQRAGTGDLAAHPYLRRPWRVFLGLSLPVFLALVAEPIAALVDTAFVKELGPGPLAAVGVGTVVMSSVFWVFAFLGQSTHTEVARRFGAGRRGDAGSLVSLAAVLAVGFGLVMCALTWTLAVPVARLMEAEGAVLEGAVAYLRIRGVGAPAVLLMTVCFGALRGLQDMRRPMWIALVVNLLNVALDALLIFGFGPVPALGVAGAAWATVIAQWVGALWALALVARSIGLTRRLHLAEAHLLLVVGFDLFFRTAMLTLFLLLSTRKATAISDEAGAAHQAIRNVWLFAALSLDAFAATAQSLVGYFRGSRRADTMRHVARVACASSLGLGLVLMTLGLLLASAVAAALVPAEARGIFHGAWWIAAVAMPLNAVSFATDGVHLGTADYRWLRNAMGLATLTGAVCLAAIDVRGEQALAWVWATTALWISVRATLGVVRVWPGSGVWGARSRAS